MTAPYPDPLRRRPSGIVREVNRYSTTALPRDMRRSVDFRGQPPAAPS